MIELIIISSWLVTVLVCALVKRSVSSFQERQIISGRELSPSRGKENADAERKFNESSITDRELEALRRIPTFQLWAESKSRAITQRKLERQQKNFVVTIFFSAVLLGALALMPFSHPIVGSPSPAPSRTLWEMASVNDSQGNGVQAQTNMGVCTSLLLLTVFTIAASCVGFWTQKWKDLVGLSREANSLVSFMATTNHDPQELAMRLDAEVAGGVRSFVEDGFPARVYRSLIVFGLLMIRFNHILTTALAPTRQVNDLSRYSAPFAAVSVESCSLGFIVACCAALVLITL